MALFSQTPPPSEGYEELTLIEFVKRKKRWAFWRGALISGVIVAIVMSSSMAQIPAYPPYKDHIAVVTVSGPIFTEVERSEMLEEMVHRDDIQGVILVVDSPGGMVYESYEIYERLSTLAETVPVVAVMTGYAASGGYMASLSAEKIYLSPATTTGSIGVIAEWVYAEEALKKLGIGSSVVRSSDVKGGPSALREPSPAEIASVKEDINAYNDLFRSMVQEKRGLSLAELNAVATGKVFIGQDAIDAKLADEFGWFGDAKTYLSENYPELVDLPIEYWEPIYEENLSSFVAKATTGVLQSLEAQAPSGWQILAK